jgi:ATP:ADP antiporter, AAA family
VVAWLGLRRGYVRELGRNLRRMNLDPHSLPMSLRESRLLGEVRAMLKSPYERVVLHGIEVLEDAAPEAIQRHVETLLEHPSVAVRLRGLRLLRTPIPEGARTRLDALLHDREAKIRVAALRARCLLDGRPTLDAIAPYLECSDLALRRSALACLIEAATADEEPQVRALIERRLREADEDERATIAEALGLRAGESTLHDFIAELVEDPSPLVRNAALVAAGRAGRRTLVPKLIELLQDRLARSAARQGLAAFGDRVVGTLGDYLADGSVPLAIRRELPRVLRDIGTPEAARALLRCRDRSDVRLAYRVLKALNRIRVLDPRFEFPRDQVGEDLEHDVRSWMFAFVHYRSCPIGGLRTAERLLCIALNERMDQALNRVFRRLGLLYRPDEVHAAYRGVLSADPRTRGSALEYLETALEPEHAALLLPLVDDSGDEKRLELAASRFGYRFVSGKASLAALIEGEDAWLRTCALFAAGSQREHELLPQVERHVEDREPFVRETALWARLALAAG